MGKHHKKPNLQKLKQLTDKTLSRAAERAKLKELKVRTKNEQVKKDLKKTIPFNHSLQFIPHDFNEIYESRVDTYVKLRRDTDTRTHEKKIRAAFNVIFANLALLHSYENMRYLSFGRSSHSHPKASSRYNWSGAGYTVFSSILEWLNDEGYIIQKTSKPQKPKKSKKGKTKEFHPKSTVQVSKMLALAFKTYDVKMPSHVDLLTKCESIRLKKGKDPLADREDSSMDKLKDYKDTKQTREWRANLFKINDRLVHSTLTLSGETLPPQVLKRQFCNESFDYGGRFYSQLLQSLPKDKGDESKRRKNLKINGKNTTEYDYKCLHISLLYADKGIQLDKDAYCVPGFGEDFRDFFKKLALVAISTSGRSGASNALRNGWEAKEPPFDKTRYKSLSEVDLKKMREAFNEYHKDIVDLIYSNGLSLKLQRRDSDLAEKIMLKYIESTPDSEDPIIPIHDSFIVPEEYGELLKRIMEESYREETGFNIRVEKQP